MSLSGLSSSIAATTRSTWSLVRRMGPTALSMAVLLVGVVDADVVERGDAGFGHGLVGRQDPVVVVDDLLGVPGPDPFALRVVGDLAGDLGDGVGGGDGDQDLGDVVGEDRVYRHEPRRGCVCHDHSPPAGTVWPGAA